MRYLAYGLLPTFAVTLALCGCGALERRPEPAFPGVVPGTTPAGASVDEVRPADRTISAGASVEPLHEVRPADPRLNLDLLVFGFSYHPDREGVRRNRLDNELNLGLGFNHAFHEDARGVGFVEAGFYKDSGRNWAKLAGPGYQFKLGERWRLGGALVGVYSPTYNHGRFFIAPHPIATYDLGAVKLNAIYIPRTQKKNNFAVFGFYFSIPFGK